MLFWWLFIDVALALTIRSSEPGQSLVVKFELPLFQMYWPTARIRIRMSMTKCGVHAMG
jgi:hypothetical protein